MQADASHADFIASRACHSCFPFTTFGEAAAFDLDVELVCRCRRIVVVDGSSPFFRDRRIMEARFTCTTILPHGARCTAFPTVYIRKSGRRGWTLAGTLPADARRTFRDIVQRGEVAQLYDQGCALPYTVSDVELDEPPWDRFLDRPVDRFVCPGAGGD